MHLYKKRSWKISPTKRQNIVKLHIQNTLCYNNFTTRPMSTVPYNNITQNTSRTEMNSVFEYILCLPRSRFLDVTQGSPKRTFSFGERCVTSKKRLRGRLIVLMYTLLGTKKWISNNPQLKKQCVLWYKCQHLSQNVSSERRFVSTFSRTCSHLLVKQDVGLRSPHSWRRQRIHTTKKGRKRQR